MVLTYVVSERAFSRNGKRSENELCITWCDTPDHVSELKLLFTCSKKSHQTQDICCLFVCFCCAFHSLFSGPH